MRLRNARMKFEGVESRLGFESENILESIRPLIGEN